MDPSLGKEIIKDIFGLSAVVIFLGTMFLAAFRWSTRPGPVGALASVPLILLIAYYVARRYFPGRSDRGDA